MKLFPNIKAGTYYSKPKPKPESIFEDKQAGFAPAPHKFLLEAINLYKKYPQVYGNL